MSNPYLDEFIALAGSANPGYTKLSLITERDRFVKTYAWAIPTPEAIALIGKYAPVVEVGAGTGYWLKLLAAAGIPAVGYDIEPYHNEQSDGNWYPVQEADARIAIKHPDDTLFLCWPPYSEAMAEDAIRSYRGPTVIYIGESNGGCTGGEGFHEILEEEWTLIDELALPQWPGIHDSLMVYQRMCVKE